MLNKLSSIFSIFLKIILHVFSSFCFADLLLRQSLLDLIFVADIVVKRFGQVNLNAGEPRTKVIHVLIQLLNCHEGLGQLFHPVCRKNMRFKS